MRTVRTTERTIDQIRQPGMNRTCVRLPGVLKMNIGMACTPSIATMNLVHTMNRA